MADLPPESPTCTVVVNVTDRDLDIVRHTIPHHLRVLGGVEEYIIAVNRLTPPQDGGIALDQLLSDLSEDARVTVREVDYSTEAVDWVSTRLFGGAHYPFHDWKGTPIHAQIEPLRAVRTTHFMHFDCDVLVGGDATSWIQDAIAALDESPGLAAASPLAGPPGGANYVAGGDAFEVNGAEARLVDGVSMRICLLSTETLLGTLAPFPIIAPTRRSHRLRGWARSSQAAEFFERSLGARTRELGFRRLDLLGRPGGAWSLHLPLKPPAVVEALPGIIEAVESDNVPSGQRGDYNLNASMCPASRLPNRADRARAIRTDIGLGWRRLQENARRRLRGQAAIEK